MMARLAGLFLAAIGCSACLEATPPVASSPSDNAEIPVQTLFTHDGCTVFRFFDAGYHYYARCNDAHASVATSSRVSCGRKCWREEEVTTISNDHAGPNPSVVSDEHDSHGGN